MIAFSAGRESINCRAMEIPGAFYNSDDQELFRHCKVCEKELIESEADYFIEKVIKRFPDLETEQCLFEYAICEDCLHKQQQKLSAESRNRIMEFYLQRVEERVESGLQQMPDLDHCMLSGRSLEETSEYQIVAKARGSRLAEIPPFMVSGQILEQISELLSAQTREELDRFRDDNFGWPPELSRKLSGGDLILT